LNESFIVGLLSFVLAFFLNKLIIAWILLIPEKIDKWVNAPTKVRNVLKDICEELKNDKSFIDNVTKIADEYDSINASASTKIVKLSNVQKLIKKYKKEDPTIDETQLEAQLKQVFINAWGDKSTINQALSKVKNDIKK